MNGWAAIGFAVGPSSRVAVTHLLKDQSVKVFGPFGEADDARQFVNGLGDPGRGIVWAVVPLRDTDSVIR